MLLKINILVWAVSNYLMGRDNDAVTDPTQTLPANLYESCVDPTYRLDRNGAHDRRVQQHIHLRDSVKYRFDMVDNWLSNEYDNTVRKSDTGELLIMLAFRHLDELPEVAEDIGFGISSEEAVNRLSE